MKYIIKIKLYLTQYKTYNKNFDFYNISATIAFDSDFQRDLISKIRSSEDVQKYLLASSKLSKHMQEESDRYVTNDKLNNASERHKLDPFYKNILQRQNP